MRGQAIGTPTFIGFKRSYKSPGLKSSEHLVERARSQVYAGKLFNIFNEGIAVFVTAREAGENENGGTCVSPESFKRCGPRPTIPISDLSVKALEAKSGLCWSRGLFSLD